MSNKMSSYGKNSAKQSIETQAHQNSVATNSQRATQPHRGLNNRVPTGPARQRFNRGHGSHHRRSIRLSPRRLSLPSHRDIPTRPRAFANRGRLSGYRNQVSQGPPTSNENSSSNYSSNSVFRQLLNEPSHNASSSGHESGYGNSNQTSHFNKSGSSAHAVNLDYRTAQGRQPWDADFNRPLVHSDSIMQYGQAYNTALQSQNLRYGDEFQLQEYQELPIEPPRNSTDCSAHELPCFAAPPAQFPQYCGEAQLQNYQQFPSQAPISGTNYSAQDQVAHYGGDCLHRNYQHYPSHPVDNSANAVTSQEQSGVKAQSNSQLPLGLPTKDHWNVLNPDLVASSIHSRGLNVTGFPPTLLPSNLSFVAAPSKAQYRDIINGDHIHGGDLNLSEYYAQSAGMYPNYRGGSTEHGVNAYPPPPSDPRYESDPSSYDITRNISRNGYHVQTPNAHPDYSGAMNSYRGGLNGNSYQPQPSAFYPTYEGINGGEYHQHTAHACQSHSGTYGGYSHTTAFEEEMNNLSLNGPPKPQSMFGQSFGGDRSVKYGGPSSKQNAHNVVINPQHPDELRRFKYHPLQDVPLPSMEKWCI